MRRSRLVPLIIATALFMENTDSTVIATALPAIAQDLRTDPIALKLALTSYLVSLAVFIPISGWMADRFGARTVFRAALGVFLAGSLACAASSSLAWFVVARFVQGMGGAMMVPVGRLVVLRSVSKSEFVGAMATLTLPALIGPLIGPPLGGFITTYFDWRWIFFINIPVGLLGIVLSTLFIENVRESESPPLDWLGFVLSGLGLALLMLGLATGGRYLLPVEASMACAGIGALFLWGYVWHARRASNPLIELTLLKVPTYQASVLGGSLFRIGVGAIPFLLPLMFQLGFGLSPLQSGSLTFASAAGAMFLKPVASSILRRFGFRTVLTLNAFVAAAFMAAHGLFTPETPHTLIIAILLLGGCSRSLEFTSLNALAFADLSVRQMSSATSLASVAQQVALSLGVALGGFALQLTSLEHGGHALQAGDFAPAFFAVAFLSALCGFIFARLKPTAGAELSGHLALVRQPPPSRPGGLDGA